MSKFDHTKIENNWKDKWYYDNIYEAFDFSEKPKKYILAELPYPSGSYLHLGHMMRYTVPEIYSRYLRMKGFNVLYPMGWDSFGLPAETFAIKENKTPKEVVDEAIENFRSSMKDMGYAIDWRREITTSEPKYYTWTQWIFLKLWEKGLVEQQEMPVWWCDELGVLADEEVLPDPNGPTGKKSERDGYPVYKKNLKQWVLKITNYADKLLEGLDGVDYFESVKNGQRNWIGRKEGVNIEYPVENSQQSIICFTTRPDTNFGTTFIALAPEHPFAKEISKENEEVRNYLEEAAAKSEVERMEDGHDNTGVFTGKYVINRLNDKKVPIWVADYVLADFGTGAVVGVPGNHKRDFIFAKKYGIEIVEVVKDPNSSKDEDTQPQEIDDVYEDYGIVKNSGFLNGLTSEKAIKKVINFLEEKGWGKRAVTYNLRDQIWSRQRYWGDPIPLIYKEDGSVEADYNLPVKLPELKDFLPEEGKSPLEKVPQWYQTTARDGTPAKRETDTMPTWAGSNWYYMRYIDPNNDEIFADYHKLKYWMPVDKYFGDAGHTNAHLLYTRFWYKVLFEEGFVPTSEPFMWRMSGGILLGADRKKMSKSREKYIVDPKDVIKNYGADALRVYLSFIGPYEETYPWNDNGIKACYRLVKNIYLLKEKISEQPDEKETTVKYHKMVKNVGKMLEDLKMNTAVSEIMIFMNHCKKLKKINKETYLGFIKVFAVFAPFTAEEIWQEANGYENWIKENSVHLQKWPEFKQKLTVSDEYTLPIQVNGKLRDELIVSKNAREDEIRELVLASKKIQKYLNNKDPKKFIYIKGKIVNLVI